MASAVFCPFIGMFKILHIVSKIFNFFRQSISSNCSLVSDSCRLFSLTWASITFGMGCDESDKPKENSSPESQINTRLVIPEYHHTDSKKWHGNSSCVIMMLLQFGLPDSFTRGSTSINTRGIASLSSTALLLVDHFCLCLSKSTKFLSACPIKFFSRNSSSSFLFFLELRRASYRVTHRIFLTFSEEVYWISAFDIGANVEPNRYRALDALR